MLNAIDVPQDATDALAAGSSATGGALGLSVEARGSFTMGHGTSTARQDGAQTATAEAYELANTSGLGGGLTIGYDIAKNLGIIASYDFRNITTREWKESGSIPAVEGGGTSMTTTQQTTNTSVIGIGLRPSIDAFGGNFYGGMGLAIVLPYENSSSVELTISGSLAPPPDNPNGTAKLDITDEWNLGLGVYGELGYNYAINDMLFAGIGVRGLIATANNDGKKSTYTTSGDPGTEGALSKSAVPTDDHAIKNGKVTTVKYAKSGDPSEIAPFQSQGITDMTFTVTVGARF